MKIHIVQKGDTLWEISKTYGVDFEEVKQLNSQLSSPDMIMPGMKVKIPSSTKPVKKEKLMIKEKEKPIVKHPQKEMSPKPLPVIKEDDKTGPKHVKVEMPMQHMPMQPVMPIMEQEMQNYTTINFPEVPKYKKPEETSKKEVPKQMVPKKEPVDQMPMQGAQPQVCYHIIHPCCSPHCSVMHGHGHMQEHPHMQHPNMHQHMMHQQQNMNHQHMMHPQHHMHHDQMMHEQMMNDHHMMHQQNHMLPSANTNTCCQSKNNHEQVRSPEFQEAPTYPPNNSNEMIDYRYPRPPGYEDLTKSNHTEEE